MSSPAPEIQAPVPVAAKAVRRFYVPQLDGLRFLAFLLVFMHHGPPLSTLFAESSPASRSLRFLEGYGWCGVDLFLVLSAFLITSLLLLEHERHGNISLRGFYLRRILRIWPLYYLMTGVGFFLLPYLRVFACAWGSPQHAQLLRTHFLPYVTLFGNFSSGRHGYPGVGTLGHLWTVTLEEQFYLAWPLLLSIMLRRKRWALWTLLALLFIGTIILRALLLGRAPHPYIWTNTLARLDPLIVGITIALWRQSRPGAVGWRMPAVKTLLGACLVIAVPWGGPIQTQSINITWQFVATAVGFGLILDAILSREGNPFAWLLSRRLLVWLGKLTYGLYVYHVISGQVGHELVAICQKRGLVTRPEWVLPLQAGISLLITIAVAAVSYRFFEAFFLRLKDRFSRVHSRPVAG